MVPLAVPLLVGPGAVVTAILVLNRDGMLIATSSIVAVFGAAWVILQASGLLHRLIGRLGSLALSRILQIFIGAIGAHFLMSGLRESLAGVSGGRATRGGAAAVSPRAPAPQRTDKGGVSAVPAGAGSRHRGR